MEKWGRGKTLHGNVGKALAGKERQKKVSTTQHGTGNGAPERKLCTEIAFVAALIAAMKNL